MIRAGGGVGEAEGRLGIPKKIGRFEILEEVGRGPITVDYRAMDPKTDRMIVLTVPSTESSDSPTVLTRFYREARAAGSLQHPNIVAIYDLGVDRGSPFITRELLEGEDLAQIAERARQQGDHAPQATAKLLDYILQICRALSYAHQRGVIHRDVRPSSIFVVRDGTAKLTNFVHARLPEAFTPVTAGHLGDEFHYSAPEQLRGERVDAGADVWAVGCTIYEVLTHTQPFQGADITAWLVAVMTQDPKPIREVRPDLPEGLDKIVRRALHKERAKRYRKIEELVEELEPVLLRMQTGASS